MKKKYPMIILLAMLLLVVFSAPAFAADNSFQGVLNQANAQINTLITKAMAEATVAKTGLDRDIANTNRLVVQNKISQSEADSRIRSFKAEFERNIYAIADRLIADTDRIVFSVIQKAEASGIKVQVNYVEVNLAGYVFLIDPLRIVGN